MNIATLQKLKLHGSVFPQSINGTDTTGTGVDTRGYSSALCIFVSGAIGAADFDKLKLLESDTDGSYAAFTGGAFTTMPGDTTDNKIWAVYVDLRKRKRYLTWEVDPGAVASLVCAIIILGGADEAPDTNAERGLQDSLTV